MSGMGKVGIYAGTFDPIHLGHIAFARQAMRDCELERLVFLPEPNPRGKQNVTSMTHRVTLLELATQDELGFEVLEFTSSCFSVRDTLPKLRQEFGNAQLTFLMGSDVARSLGHWEDIATLLQNASITIGLRKNDDSVSITAALLRLSQEQGIPVRYTLVSAPNADMSSSGVRNGAASLTHLPRSVFEYIERNRLYVSARSAIQ